MSDERRQHTRIATNVSVRFQKQHLDRRQRKELAGVVENCSAGGMFISTDDIFPKGSVLTLEFEVESEDEEAKVIEARAVVRWSKRWGERKGMGLEFVEFTGLGDSSFAQWMATLAKKAMQVGTES